MIECIQQHSTYKTLVNSNMETSLIDLVLDVAPILFTKITQHLAEHPFQGVVAHLTTWLLCGLDRLVPVVTDIECRAVEMARVLGCISIASSQLGDIILRTQDAGHNNLMQRDSFDLKRVEVSTPDVLQQYGGTRDKIRDTIVKLVNIKERIAPT